MAGLLPGRLSFSSFAQASLSDTVRLNIRVPEVESESVQKYPRRSNWYRVPGHCLPQAGLNQTARDSLQRVGVEIGRPIVVRRHLRQIRHQEGVVESDFGFHSMGCGDPMDGGLDLALFL